MVCMRMVCKPTRDSCDAFTEKEKKTYSTVTGAILRVSAPGIDTPSPAFCDAFIAGGAAGFPLASVSVSS